MIERYFSGQPYLARRRPHWEEDAARPRSPSTPSPSSSITLTATISRAAEAVWGLVSAVNKYLVETEPWVLAEDTAKRARLATVLWTAAEGLRIATLLLYPVIPTATERVRQQLGLDGELAATNLDELSWGQLATGVKIGRVEAVFPRLEKDEAIEQLWAQEKEMTAALAAPGKAAKVEEKTWITIDEFAKVEMRVAEVRTAERVKGANKLLKLTVDIGEEVRQVIAGIAEAYTPEELIGKKVVIVVNLQPRKSRGLESNGMIVAASVGEKGRPVLVTFAEDVPVGARLK
jgi:methionyl-tRNA synthetase